MLGRSSLWGSHRREGKDAAPPPVFVRTFLGGGADQPEEICLTILRRVSKEVGSIRLCILSKIFLKTYSGIGLCLVIKFCLISISILKLICSASPTYGGSVCGYLGQLVCRLITSNQCLCVLISSCNASSTLFWVCSVACWCRFNGFSKTLLMGIFCFYRVLGYSQSTNYDQIAYCVRSPPGLI
jgi:hypothetical protein